MAPYGTPFALHGLAVARRVFERGEAGLHGALARAAAAGGSQRRGGAEQTADHEGAEAARVVAHVPVHAAIVRLRP
jgi:hypothetical protein